MTSDKQTEANRRNARKSTGPKTPEGKDIASRNAMKHGILSREVVLPDEDKAAFEELKERLWADLEPVGELESLLVDKIIADYWRLHRLNRVEAVLFLYEMAEVSMGDSLGRVYSMGAGFIRDSNGANAFSKVSRYETATVRSLYKALHELQRLQAARRAESNVPHQ